MSMNVDYVRAYQAGTTPNPNYATNNVSGFEEYNQTSFGGLKSVSGSYANLANGRVRIQVWSAIGNASSTLRVNASAANGNQSVILIPFN